MAVFRYEREKNFFCMHAAKNEFFFDSKYFFYSVLTCMMGDTVRSKPWLGLLGNVSAAMATAAAFGFAIYMRVEFIGINLAAPFLMIGEFMLGFLIHSLTLSTYKYSRINHVTQRE